MTEHVAKEASVAIAGVASRCDTSSAIVEREPGGTTSDDVPIIALRAAALRGDRERILAGCNEHLAKPIEDLSKFSGLIEKYLTGRE